MNIAFEISPLITASGTFGDKSGVYRYTFGLLKSLIKRVNVEQLDEKIYLFTFAPQLLLYSLNPEILELIDYKTVFLIGYDSKVVLQKQKENDFFEILSFPLIKIPLKIFDKLFQIRKMLVKYQQNKAFKKYINDLNKEFMKQHVQSIFHSETGFYPFPKFNNLITIYDLTTKLLPNLHREETCDLQARKIRFAKKYCQGIITISESTKKDLQEYSYHFRHIKIKVGYPGLDNSFKINSHLTIEDLNKLIDSYNVKLKKNKYFLYYGTFEPRKNIEYIIRAFSQLYNEGKIPGDFKLILIGGTGWGKIKIQVENFVKENYPIRERSPILILDYINDDYLNLIIKNAFAVVYPSIYEGFGLPVLESMAIGTPVICSNTSSLPEVGGDAALYVNPKNYFEIKDKMEYLVNHPKIIKDLTKKGIKQSSKFTWERTADGIYKFMKDL